MQLPANFSRAQSKAQSKAGSEIRFWIIALIIGVLAGAAAIIFRFGINALQSFWYQTNDVNTLHSHAMTLAWYWVVLVPVIGGAIVGVITHFFIKDGIVRSVSHVIEGAALNRGRMDMRSGIASALSSMVTLGMGGSTGREGPVVHIAAMISTKMSDMMAFDGRSGRDLLGCATAAAVAASFNAPLAGALFALEVILRHYALHALAPITIAAVAGAAMNRIVFGDVTEFDLPQTQGLSFYAELPMFILLGLACGFVAVVMIKSMLWADQAGTKILGKMHLPNWTRPMISGFCLGLLAVQFPHIIGVGYETTNLALLGALEWQTALMFVGIKIFALSITMGGRMGGGVFSPSLMCGALFGLGFGLIVAGFWPLPGLNPAIFALAGMGAVAGSVLGAPISTILIVFELTGDWQTAMAVMVAVTLSSWITSKYVARSFFLTQLANRGVQLWLGPQAYLLRMFKVERIMRRFDEGSSQDLEEALVLMQNGAFVRKDHTLEEAMQIFDAEQGVMTLPVLDAGSDHAELVGLLYKIDALQKYNAALCATSAEQNA